MSSPIPPASHTQCHSAHTADTLMVQARQSHHCAVLQCPKPKSFKLYSCSCEVLPLPSLRSTAVHVTVCLVHLQLSRVAELGPCGTHNYLCYGVRGVTVCSASTLAAPVGLAYQSSIGSCSPASLMCMYSASPHTDQLFFRRSKRSPKQLRKLIG